MSEEARLLGLQTALYGTPEEQAAAQVRPDWRDSPYIPKIVRDAWDKIEQGNDSQADRAVVNEYEELTIEDQITTKQLLIAVILKRIAEKPEGMKALERVSAEAVRGYFQTCVALAKASAANPISAWANPYLLSTMLERFGLVKSGRMVEFRIGISLQAGMQIATDILSKLTKWIPFSPAAPTEFPQQLDLSDSNTYTTVVQTDRVGVATH